MRKPYVHVHPDLKLTILARVRAGASLRSVCGEAGFPSKTSVIRWAKADAGFGEALAAAQRVGRERRYRAFDPARAEAILRRLAGGERIDRILADPAMPSERAYRLWRAREAGFGGEVERLKRVRCGEAVARMRAARLRVFDQAVADRVYLMVLRGAEVRALRRLWPEAPCREVLARWRLEQPEFDRMMRMAVRVGRRARLLARPAPGLTRRRIEAIAAHIRLGGSLASYARRPGTPALSTLYAWAQRDARFKEALQRACGVRALWYADEIADAQDRAAEGGGGVRAMRRASAALSRQEWRLRRWPGRGTWALRRPPLR